MQFRHATRGRRIAAAIACIAAAAILYIFRSAIFRVLTLILGALVLAFLARPFTVLFEKRFSKNVSALLGLVSLGLIVAFAAWIILPVMIRETAQLIRLLPQSIEQLAACFGKAESWLRARFGGFITPGGISGANGSLTEIAAGTIAFAGSLADIAGRASLMIVLCFFFLCDREGLLLRLELLIPRRHRAMAVRMGNAVIREMRVYLRGQAVVAVSVAALATAGLMIIRVRSAIALGPIIGILNMIPYFGPFIGGVPAVLIALADSWQKATLALLVIVVVQQVDNSVISPRVMGSVTGLSPAFVLIAIFAGSQVAGIAGMLFALPLIMTFRTLFRVFVQRHENI